MLHRLFSYALLLIILSSCGVSKFVDSPKFSFNRVLISASNLSEDGSILSTGEDELLLFLFPYSANAIDESVLSETFTLNKERRTHEKEKATLSVDTFLLVLIERDSNRAVNTLEKIVRSEYQGLLNAYQNHNLSKIEAVLGDDDLLGIRIITPSKHTINFEGVWRADRYAYQIRFAE